MISIKLGSFLTSYFWSPRSVAVLPISHSRIKPKFYRLSGKPGMLSMLLASAILVDAAPSRTTEPASSAMSKVAPAPQKGTEKKPNPPVDTGAIRRYYMEGDFDPAIDILETALRYKSGFSHADSLFIFKHLGVMYTAKYETREKGKHFMRRLLEVDPTARILDMYASDMIYMIFKNIKDEFDTSHERLVRPDTTRVGDPGSGSSAGRQKRDSPRKKSSSAYLWLGLTATMAVAGGAATYFYFSDEQKTETLDHQPD